MQNGDKSTSFFHSWVKQRRRKKAIVGTLIDGDWITDKYQVADSMVDYFHSAFTDNVARPAMADLVDCIPNLVTAQDNDNLMVNPTMQEVRDVVFSMDKHSMAGSDGFNRVFYQSFWDIVGVEVFNAVRYFMEGATLPRGLTSTVLTLLAKCDGPKTWKQFRPISLCIFANKVITKLINNRLSAILPKIISEFHTGFVRGWLIQDNILLAHELVHHLDKGKDGGNVMLKLDMTKAFDMLSWEFLCLILEKFRFA
ncbi:hypothetical protein LIER_26323 [Lithospermum erythrorhizon]|uniref:Reverse transcriptase domain-containing protein n=1 Tax=Lithospermum erythrorhizon TaxID=34254 RepID=A0AAV3RDS8_LITER